MNVTFSLRLFGSFEFRDPANKEIPISSAKIRAMIALLSLAPNGRHSRALLQEMLWGRAGAENGRLSLRRALSDLRTLMGAQFDDLFKTSNSEVELLQENLTILGDRTDGIFLEGMDLPEDRFNQWLRERRSQSNDSRLRVPSLIEARLSPVISIIPFIPAFAEGKDAQIGDFLAMEIVRAVSKCPYIDVISHLSSRRIQYQSLDLMTLRREMNVDYLITGSYRMMGDKIVLTADFIDVQSERVIWTRDSQFSIASISSAGWSDPAVMAQHILDTIISQSVKAIHQHPTRPPAVHQRLMAAVSLMHQHRKEVVGRAYQELKSLIRENPGHAMFHAWLAKLHVISAHQRWNDPELVDPNAALWHSKEALRLDPTCSLCAAVRGLVLTNLFQDFQAGAEQMDLALENDNSNALAWLLKGAMLAFSDRGAEAVLCTSKARNLSPLDPHQYYYDCLAATAHLSIGDNETAAQLAERSYTANPRHASTLRVKTIAYHELGKMEAAQASASELMTLNPDFNVTAYLKFHPASNFEAGQTWARALSQAGVPLN